MQAIGSLNLKLLYYGGCISGQGCYSASLALAISLS